MSRPRRPQRPERSNESGAVAIMVAICCLMLLSVMAFVTDFGAAYTNKQRIQNGVDAAVLAVAQQIALTAPGTSTCAQMAAMSATMRPVAEKYLADNAPEAAMPAGTEGFELSCGSKGLIVKVVARQNSPVYFGQVMGFDDIPIGQAAKSAVAPAGSIIGLRPFAICQADANKLKAQPGVSYNVSVDNADLGCLSAAGNWGVMDFDGGSNPAGDTEKWVRDGYDGPISVAPPVFIDGDPGFPSPGKLKDAMTSILDDEIVLPVFDQVTGTGANSKFRLTGFISVQLCAFAFNNKGGLGSCYTNLSPAPGDYLQLRFKRFIPIGELNTSCTLGTATCDNGVRLFGLAE